MSKLKVNLENIAALKPPATPTQAECVSASQLAHTVASETAASLETRASFAALADELGKAPEKLSPADPRAARLLREVISLANQVLPTTT